MLRVGYHGFRFYNIKAKVFSKLHGHMHQDIFLSILILNERGEWIEVKSDEETRLWRFQPSRDDCFNLEDSIWSGHLLQLDLALGIQVDEKLAGIPFTKAAPLVSSIHWGSKVFLVMQSMEETPFGFDLFSKIDAKENQMIESVPDEMLDLRWLRLKKQFKCRKYRCAPKDCALR